MSKEAHATDTQISMNSTGARQNVDTWVTIPSMLSPLATRGTQIVSSETALGLFNGAVHSTANCVLHLMELLETSYMHGP